MIARFLRRCRRERRAATIIEFGLLCPVLLILIMGLGELLYQSYVKSILIGEMQKAGRDAGIQGGDTSTAVIDGKIITRLSPIMASLANNCGTGPFSTPVWCSTRKSYDTFTEIAPENFTDSDGDGIRDPGECFDDVNANGVWDADPGANGQGGASAVTLYTMTVNYPPMFPVVSLLGWPSREIATATTALKNQPYATQTTTATTTICT